MYETFEMVAHSAWRRPTRCISIAALLLTAAAAPAQADATVVVESRANVQDPEAGKVCPEDPIGGTVVLADADKNFERKYTSECGQYRAVLLVDGEWQEDSTFKLTVHSFADRNYCELVFNCGWHICSPGPEHVIERTYTRTGFGEGIKDAVTLQDVESDWDVAHLDTSVGVYVMDGFSTALTGTPSGS